MITKLRKKDFDKTEEEKRKPILAFIIDGCKLIYEHQHITHLRVNSNKTNIVIDKPENGKRVLKENYIPSTLGKDNGTEYNNN